MDNEIDRKIDVTAILFQLVQNKQQTMTEPWLDQVLMGSAYMSYAWGCKDMDYKVIVWCNKTTIFQIFYLLQDIFAENKGLIVTPTLWMLKVWLQF